MIRLRPSGSSVVRAPLASAPEGEGAATTLWKRLRIIARRVPGADEAPSCVV